MTTVTRLFDSHTEALRALDDLERAGVDHDDISLAVAVEPRIFRSIAGGGFVPRVSG